MMRTRRSWQLKQGSRPERTFAVGSEPLILDLQRSTGLSPMTLQVCVLRGLETAEAIQAFLSPRFENLKSPFTLKDLEKAVDRLILAQEKGEKIWIFGDYDVDGTTGAALLTWVLRDLGFFFEVRQPDRFKDGYGLNPGAVEEAVRGSAQVLVTVDCGISSFVAAERAQEMGLDLIVVDHHQLDVEKGLPPAYAVVNPQRPDCDSGLKQLCGCGLAFYLMLGLRARARQRGWFVTRPEPNLKTHLDLVVMATAADMVPLTGDNHILVRYGMEVLKHTKKPGVQALLDVAGLRSRDVSPSHLGFLLGPRINASGRMQSASLALELLTTENAERAQELALTLERLNQERMEVQNQIWDEVRARIEKGLSAGQYKHGIVIADSSWHEGVIGIVASRVTETFHKPAAVVSLREDFGKGSVRSFGGKDVLQGLRCCADVLLGFGGHKYAAGLSVSLDKIDLLAERFDQAIGESVTDVAAEALWIEAFCGLSDLDLRTLEELERLGPFGPGNPEPVFAVRASVKDHRILKERHLKLNLMAHQGAVLQEMSAIWFHAVEKVGVVEQLSASEEQEWAGVPELNRYRGRVTPTFRVKDWRKFEVSCE